MSEANDSSSHISQSSGLSFTPPYQTTCKSKGGLTCIPSTEEKYISFSKRIKVDEYKSRKSGETVSLNFEIRFIDSFKFLQTSFANLVSNLQPKDFKNTKAIIKNNVGLLTRVTILIKKSYCLSHDKD